MKNLLMQALQTILEISSSQHKHLCPRQVLGAHIGLPGATALGLDAPGSDKRLLIIAETDDCFAAGVVAATGCTMGQRTLCLADYGKIAATFVDVKTETANASGVYDTAESRSGTAVVLSTQRAPSAQSVYYLDRGRPIPQC